MGPSPVRYQPTSDVIRRGVTVRLDAGHHFDAEQRACIIDAGTPVGRDFNRLFTGFISREFGADAFRVERVQDVPAASHQEVPVAV